MPYSSAFSINEQFILEELASGQGHISGEALSERMGVSRAAVWKHVQKLRKKGFSIEASPSRGYLLANAPDELFGALVKPGLNSMVIGSKNYHYFEKVSSTNVAAYECAEKGASEGEIFVAKQQVSGKGRFGREWLSPEGGIYFSVILRPPFAPSVSGSMSLVAAISTAEAIGEVLSFRPEIKWPNDIFFKGRKLGGILIEMKAQSDLIDFLILGIGINAKTPLRKVPENALTLEQVAKNRFTKVQLFRSLLRHLDKDYILFKAAGFEPFLERSREFSCTVGKDVLIKRGGFGTEGYAEGIDTDGALILRTDGGKKERFVSGDVTLREKK